MRYTDICFQNAWVVDGSGKPGFKGDVLVKGDRIALVTAGPCTQLNAETQVVDAHGLVLCPGFIDIQSHSIHSLLMDGRCVSKISQGITCEIMGETWTPGPVNDNVQQQLGEDWHWPRLGQWLDTLAEQGVSPNVGTMLAGHNVRACVMGMSMDEPDASQIAAMQRVVEAGMEDGALGISYALIYPPDVYATTNEIIAMCQVVQQHGGIYCTHMRSEGERLLEGVEEALLIGQTTGIAVEIYHLKASGKANWGKMPQVIERINQARAQGVDVEANMYSYTASGTGLTTILPPWTAAGDRLYENLADEKTRQRIREEVLNPQGDWEPQLKVTGAHEIMVLDMRQPENRRFVGMRLSEVAKMMGAEPVDAAIALLQSEKQRIFSVFVKMSEANIELQMQQDWVKFSTDAPGHNPDLIGGPVDSRSFHPRCYGTLPRVLGKYVRERKILELEQAIAKMSGQVARRLGLTDRGLIREGMKADLVLFDADEIIDCATYEQPHEFSKGVRGVWVNGVKVWDGERHTGALPGQVIRRQDAGGRKLHKAVAAGQESP